MRGVRVRLSASLMSALVVALAPSVGGASETSFTISGKTTSDNAESTHTLTCPSGSYVASSGKHRKTVFDDPGVDTSGTNSGVAIDSSVTTTLNWGHPDSQLATGIAFGVGNNRKGSGKSLRFSITTHCTSNKDDAWVVLSSSGLSSSGLSSSGPPTSGLSSSGPPTSGLSSSSTDTTEVFSGTTEGNKIYRHNFNCAPGYVKNTGEDSGTIFDRPYFDTTGTDPLVYTDRRATGSVEWGHFGSRLANAIEVAAGYPGFTENSYPYKITVKCTSDQQDAWVILFS